MRIALVVWTGLAVVFAGMPAPTGAQQGNLRLTLSTAAIAFPTPGVPDFDTGWIEHTGVVVSIRSRPPQAVWELRVRADDPNMGGYGKPVSDIMWRLAGSGSWISLTPGDIPVTQGTGDAEVTVYFRTRLEWETDVPDTYSAGLTWTVVRP